MLSGRTGSTFTGGASTGGEISMWFPITRRPSCLFPVISWIALGGKCHYCGTKIPLRYPLIEFGFTCFYGITFLLFFTHPLFLCGLWIAAVIVLLLFRCSSHLRGTLKGIMIFTGYHLIYSAVFLIIYAALGLL